MPFFKYYFEKRKSEITMVIEKCDKFLHSNFSIVRWDCLICDTHYFICELSHSIMHVKICGKFGLTCSAFYFKMPTHTSGYSLSCKDKKCFNKLFKKIQAFNDDMYI